MDRDNNPLLPDFYKGDRFWTPKHEADYAEIDKTVSYHTSGVSSRGHGYIRRTEEVLLRYYLDDEFLEHEKIDKKDLEDRIEQDTFIPI